MNLFDVFFPRTRIVTTRGGVRVALCNTESGARMSWWRTFKSVEGARQAIKKQREKARKNRKIIGLSLGNRLGRS